MDATDDRSGEYWIDVKTIEDPDRDCCIATVVVISVPEMREVFRAEFPTGPSRRTRPQDALAAAIASGQQAIRMEQCRLHGP